MFEDLALNLGAGLLHDYVVKPGIQTAINPETRELDSAYKHAFTVMFAEMPSTLSAEKRERFERQWREFVGKPTVRHLFLDLALQEKDEDTLNQLREEYIQHGFALGEVNLIDRFYRGLTEGLVSEAEKPDSNLFNMVTLGKLSRMISLTAHTGQQVDELKAAIQELTARLGAVKTHTRSCPKQVHMPEKFGGREERLTEIMSRIKAGTDVAITAVYGMGGIGKTTLAQALAARMLADNTFRAVLWADVTRTPDATAIISHWVQTFADASFDTAAFANNFTQMAQSAKTHLDDVIAEHCELCDPPRVLVVLDDVWDNGVEAARLLKLACPEHTTLLITTRSENVAVDLKASAESLAYLRPHEAVEMLKLYLENAPDAVLSRLGQALGGHALALELASRRIQKDKRPGEPEGQKYERLVAEYERGIPAGSAFSRLQLEQREQKEDNLTVSLALSYEPLLPDDQARFRALGVLAYDTPFDPLLLAALWQLPLDDTYEHANQLRLLSLLEIDGDGYRQHGLLRAYARALLTDEGETEATFNRYADYVIEQAEQFNTLKPEDWGQLDTLLPHVDFVGAELVRRWNATENPDEALTQRCGNFSYQVVRYVERRPQAVTTANSIVLRGLDWLEMGLTASRQTEDQRRESLFLNQIALAWTAVGEKLQALNYYEQALTLDQTMGEQGGEATTLNNIGRVWDDLGERRKALEYYEQALPLSQAVGDQRGEASILSNVGNVWTALGEARKALQYHEQALKLRQEVGDKGGEGNSLLNIGFAWNALGEKHKALDYFEQALPLRQAEGDQRGEATTLNNIGSVWSALGEKRKALEYYEQALLITRQTGDRGNEATTLNNIGGVWDALGEKRTALDYFEQALSLFRAVGDRGGEATTLNNMASIYFYDSELEKSVEIFRQIIEIFRAIGAVSEEAAILMNTAVVYQQMGRISEAIESAQAGRDILIRYNLPQDASGATVAQCDAFLAQLRGEPAAPSPEDEQTKVMQLLLSTYQQGGAAALRELLEKSDLDAEQIEAVITGIAAQADTSAAPSAPSTLPPETVQQLANNTFAVMTQASDQRDNWRAQIVTLRDDFAGRGDDWAIEVVFADALLAILDQTPVPPMPDNPYAGVVQQVIAAINQYHTDNPADG